jgi:hypothetical protein
LATARTTRAQNAWYALKVEKRTETAKTVSERAARDLQADCGELLEAMQSKVALSTNRH